MDLAIPAFEDPPVRSRMAQVAMPLDQRVIGLDHLEDMRAVVGEGHIACCRLSAPVSFLILASLRLLRAGRGREGDRKLQTKTREMTGGRS